MMFRLIEFLLALLGLILLLPLFFLIALAIKLDSKGPVFYRAKRVGKGEKLITMLKFRTMKDKIGDTGLPITTKEDQRITRMGRFLRKMKMDELPQLMNVLVGQMRFVGPRPEDPIVVQKYTLDQRKIFQYRPGITSPASLAYRAEENLIPSDQWEKVYLNEILPKKLKMDGDYMHSATFWSDIMIILKTLHLSKKKL